MDIYSDSFKKKKSERPSRNEKVQNEWVGRLWGNLENLLCLETLSYHVPIP